MTIDVRSAVTADISALLTLLQAYRVFYEREADPVAEAAYLGALMRDGASTIFVAECDGQLAGFVQLFKTYNTVRLQPAFVLEDLYVQPESRGGGVASALLDACIAHARREGATVMFLETAHDNLTAQRVYERNGWTRETQFYKYNAPLD